MAKYRAKPDLEEIQQFAEGNIYRIPHITGEGYQRNVSSELRENPPLNLVCTTLKGHMKIEEGNYIVKGLIGDFYPVCSDIFEQTYELVEE